MTTTFAKRPKWARPLRAAQWRHLVETTGPRPTLRALRVNLDYQRRHNMVCIECAAIDFTLHPSQETTP